MYKMQILTNSFISSILFVERMRRALCRVGLLSLSSAAIFSRCCSTKLFTDSHEWVSKSGEEVTLGITKYAQENLGDIVYVSLPQPGDVVASKDVIGEVESVKATSNVYTPVSGTVTVVNEKLKDQPGLINKAAENDGWLVKLKTTDNLTGLMNDKEYAKYLE